MLVSKGGPSSLYEDLKEDELRAKEVCEIRKLIIISILCIRTTCISSKNLHSHNTKCIGADQEKWNKLNNRRVQHYGFEFNYTTNDIGNISIRTPLLSFYK